MSAILYPLINGVRHGFSSIEAKIAGQIFIGFKSISYERTRSRSEARGAHADPIGKSRGTNAYKCSIEMYLAEAKLLQDLLQSQAPAGGNYGDVFFPISVTYNETWFDTIFDSILGCTLDSTKGGGSDGADPLMRSFELNPLKILFNGQDDTRPLVGVAF